jgi:deoxyribodipyrimidine photolyase-related protein
MNCAWILGDQLDARWPRWLADAGLTPSNTRLLFVESGAKLKSRPWHRHKLTLVLAAMRHFAGQLRALGWTVTYIEARDFTSALRQHFENGKDAQLFVMRPSTWQGAQFVESLAGRIGQPVTVWPNRMFLAQPGDLGGAKKPLLENFYRAMRKRTGLLMDGAQPAGGAWNHDADNRQPPRKPWRAGNTSDIPALPRMPPDDITLAVIDKVRGITSAWGASDGFALPVTQAAAQAFFEVFLRERLPQFGPYEDAMVPGQATLFHSLISPLLNLGLLERDAVCAAAEAEYRAGRRRSILSKGLCARFWAGASLYMPVTGVRCRRCARQTRLTPKPICPAFTGTLRLKHRLCGGWPA